MTAIAVDTLASALLAAYDDARLLPLPSSAHPGMTLDDGYAVADAVRRLRQARGEQPRGWKIGFTNRTIWPKYGVHAPIWGTVWNSTLQLLEGTEARVSLAGLAQPRIEPEVVFGFGRTPEPGMDLAALCGCLEWVAHGFEVVHTHYEGWRFTAPDGVADQGLHARLIVGPRVAVASWASMGEDLSAMTLALQCDGREVDRGRGANVLDGPLQALAAWLQAMAAQAPRWSVQAGDVVTTGTLTDAWPLAAGQRWTSAPGAEQLAGLTLQVDA